jgi:hypothetical protein
MNFISSKVSIVSFIISIMLFSITANSQTGAIKGVVKEKGTNETMPGTTVVIEGTTTGASTDFDGQYIISGLKPGLYNLSISYISYKTQTINNVSVVAGQDTEINIFMETETIEIEGVQVQARALRERENVLLLEQKSAAGMIQQIGSQELSRKGVSDVAAAVAKISGVSKVEGSNDVYVRGLGDRYNSTTLNGLPMPSNNPEQKNISLDIFSTDIVEYITIDKVYNNLFVGDFAGGNVDINSKDFTGDSFLSISVGSNINTNLIDEGSVPVKAGPTYFGNHKYTPPTSIENYDFNDRFEPNYMNPIGSSISISAGNKHRIKEKREINYFTTINFDNSFSASEGISKSVNNTGFASKDFVTKSFSYSTNTTGMLNMGYKFNNRNKINFNTIYINSSSNSYNDYNGLILDISDSAYLNRKSFEQNTVLINQLLGKNDVGEKSQISWGVSYNTIENKIPDRIQNTYINKKEEYVFGQNQITDNHRYFHKLNEYEIAANVFFTTKLINDIANDYKLKLTAGLTSRQKQREFSAVQYNFRINTSQRATMVDPDNISDFLNQQNLENEFYRIETFRGSYQVPFALDPQVYSGNQIIHGALLSGEYKFTDKFVAVLGLRAESIFQEVQWNTQLDPSDKKDAFELIPLLPSITTKYEISEKQNIRFGASKTYTLPQFKERAKYIYEEVTQVKLGNPDLYPSTNYNSDIKWEYFPSSGEIFSLGVFGKYILNPINEVTIASASSDISFVNTGDWGYVAGVEFETRKKVLDMETSKLQIGFNASYMITDQELNSEKIKEETIYAANFTHERARFTGASDLLLNSDISFTKSWNENKNDLMTTISYNFFSDRVYAIGTNDGGNLINKHFNTVDLIIKSGINNFSLSFGIKNILNPNIETYQANKDEDIIVESYKKGIGASFSIGYKF